MCFSIKKIIICFEKFKKSLFLKVKKFISLKNTDTFFNQIIHWLLFLKINKNLPHFLKFIFFHIFLRKIQ